MHITRTLEKGLQHLSLWSKVSDHFLVHLSSLGSVAYVKFLFPFLNFLQPTQCNDGVFEVSPFNFLEGSLKR